MSLRLVLLMSALFTWGTASASDKVSTVDTVDEILHRASSALQEADYKGRFTYEFGNSLETLEVLHAVRDGIEYERINHLNGIKREFVRSGRSKDCVSVGSFLLRGGLINAAGGAVSLAQNYHFYIRGEDRIAGRLATVVQVVPKDEYRYGMTIAVDKSSDLPLMSMITTSENSALERFQFVQLSVGEAIVESELEPVDEVYGRLEGGQASCSKPPQGESMWRATWVPPGFVLSHISSDKQDGDMLTYTDGIASFTLFVSAVGDVKAFKQGIARRGATTALMSLLPMNAKHVGVVLVGEVPVAAAQQVVASVRQVE